MLLDKHRAHWPTKGNTQKFIIFPAHTKNWLGGPKWGREVLFPANPDLADILGRTDLDFEKFYFLGFFGSQISGFPGSQISKIWPLAGLGPGQARLEPPGPKNVDFLL